MKDVRNKLIIGGLIGLAVIVGLLLYTDLKEMGAYARTFPPLYIIPILSFTLVNYSLRWIKWHYYLHLIGIKDISRINSAAVFIGGFVLALSPGKVAELLRSVVLREMTGTPVARSAPVIIADRVTDGLAMLVLGAISFGGMLFTSAENNEVLFEYVPAYFAVLGILLTGIIVIQIRPLFMWILNILEKIPVIGRLSKALHELYESSYELFRPIPLLVAVGIGTISWSGESIGFFLILHGLGLDASWLLLWQAMFMLAAATIIGAVSGLPGGLGAAEFTIVGMIQLFVLHHSDPGFAGTAALLIRLATLWFGVILGLVTAFVFRKRLFPEKIDQTWRTAQAELQSDATQ
jgi:uncharacterized protein (TIRG00374 family)